VSPRRRDLRETSSVVGPPLPTRPLPSTEMSGWQGNAPETWQVSTSRTQLGLSAGGVDCDATFMEVGVTLTVAPAEIARAYADRLGERWPEVAVYYGKSQAGPDALRIAVVAPKWDLELEKATYELMWIPEAEEAGLALDVTAYFEDRSAPDLTGFTRVR
jgi:hypothetical protein